MHRLQRSIWVANRLAEKIFQWRLNSGAAWMKKWDTKMWLFTKPADKSKILPLWEGDNYFVCLLLVILTFALTVFDVIFTDTVTQCLRFYNAPKSQPWKKNGGGIGGKRQSSKIVLTSCVCSWKAYRMPSISCSSSRESTSEDPRLPIVWKWRTTP